MIDYSRYQNILDNHYNDVLRLISNGNPDSFFLQMLSEKQKKLFDCIVNNVENQKSVLSVLITSILKKIADPNQDIRLHREEFKDGYSGRSLDTKVVTPWLKQNYTKFAPKESGWLTRSIEQPHPFDKNFPGKIRNKKVKKAFLEILYYIENNNYDPAICLKYIIFLLEKEKSNHINIINEIENVTYRGEVTINFLINLFRKHFALKNSSRLPVIAMYSIYQCIFQKIDLYKSKCLMPLNPHTAADRHIGYGDIEIYDINNAPYEIVEIKHNIPIDKNMIIDVLNKIKETSIKRYYILTTAEPNFLERDKDEIFKLTDYIKNKLKIEIIPNGVLPTLKYYMRFIENPLEVITLYIQNVKSEFKSGTDVRKEHIQYLHELIAEFNINKKANI